MSKFLAPSFLILILAVTASADTLLAYEQRVQRAGEIASRLKARPTNASELADDIETLLPKSEQVDFDGDRIWVDNSWVHTLLDSYKQKPNADGTRAQLDELRTKLAALNEQLVKVEEAPSSQDRSASDREALKRILARPEFQEKKEDFLTTAFKKVRDAVFRAVQNILARLFKLIFGERGESSWLFKGFVIVVAALFIGIAIFLIAKRRPVRKKPQAKKQIILDEEIGPNTTSKDLLNEALTAYRKGEFRLGIRRLYIALLYELGERGIIELDRHATNSEYLKKAAAVGALEPPMRYLTERFDYFWYGRFPAQEEDFSAFKASFDQATRVVESRSGQKNPA